MQNANKTKDVEVLLGAPKKAMLAMAIPVIIAMIVQNLNNVIDSVWVAGLGSNALAAVGLVFPIFAIMISVGNGIGIGSSATIARFIGMDKKESADEAARQAIFMTIVGSIVIGILLFFIQKPLFLMLGAEDALSECMAYTTPLVICTPILLVNVVLANLLRSEGASRKSMYSQILTAVINIILDPLFIYDYGLGMGIAGAAWATCTAMMCSLALLVYWYFFSGKTYLKINLRNPRFDLPIDKEIMRVGLPASMEMVFISFVSMISNSIIIMAAGTDGVAIFSSTFRILQIAMIPLMGLGSAIVPVCAAAYGLRRFNNIKISYFYAIKLGTVLIAIISLIMFLFPDVIVTLFTYDESTVHLKDGMIYGLRACCIFLVFVPAGFITAGFFQSLGMGTKSLICTVMRNLIVIPICYVFVITIGGIESYWTGFVIAEILGTIITAGWGIYTLRVLLKERSRDKPSELSSV